MTVTTFPFQTGSSSSSNPISNSFMQSMGTGYQQSTGGADDNRVIEALLAQLGIFGGSGNQSPTGGMNGSNGSSSQGWPADLNQYGQYGGVQNMQPVNGKLPTMKITTEHGDPLQLQYNPSTRAVYNMQGKSVGSLNQDGSLTLNSDAKEEQAKLEHGVSDAPGFLQGALLDMRRDDNGNATFKPDEITENAGDLPQAPRNGTTTGAIPVQSAVWQQGGGVGYNMPGGVAIPGMENAAPVNGQLPTMKITTEHGDPLQLQYNPDTRAVYNMQGKSVGALNQDGSLTLNSDAKEEQAKLEHGVSDAPGFLQGALLDWRRDDNGNATFKPDEITENAGDLPQVPQQRTGSPTIVNATVQQQPIVPLNLQEV
ncbi:hypothetical protein LJR230_004093 [Trinickia sp. LjRoot230]|uniref:hypothetical protein n=1 Tax=Trinickia sp. LjRoot230 TaxID=3342288 RepID=UPI003ECC7BB7